MRCLSDIFNWDLVNVHVTKVPTRFHSLVKYLQVRRQPVKSRISLSCLILLRLTWMGKLNQNFTTPIAVLAAKDSWETWKVSQCRREVRSFVVTKVFNDSQLHDVSKCSNRVHGLRSANTCFVQLLLCCFGIETFKNVRSFDEASLPLSMFVYGTVAS